MSTRLVLEIDEPGWTAREEFETVADVIDYLVVEEQNPEHESVAAGLLRGVLEPEEDAVPAPRGSHLRAVPAPS